MAGLRAAGLGSAVAVAVIVFALYLGGAFHSGGNRPKVPTIGEGLRRELAARPLSSFTGGARDSPASRGRAGSRAPISPALAALNSYWSDIGRHEFAAAFGYYAPGATNLTEANFISSMQRSGVKTVDFIGTVTASTKSLILLDRSFATVAVTSLVTRDEQHGCRRWSGSYTMVLEESGLWHIQRAGLNTHPC